MSTIAYLDRTTTCNHLSVLYSTLDDHDRIMQTTLALLENKAVAAHCKYADRASPVLHTGDANNFGACMSCLLHQICISELVFRERLDVCNRLASK